MCELLLALSILLGSREGYYGSCIVKEVEPGSVLGSLYSTVDQINHTLKCEARILCPNDR